MEDILMKALNYLLKDKGIKIYGETIVEANGVKHFKFQSFINRLVNRWNEFTNKEKELISHLLLKTNKNYLGDIKWVIYQHICDMNSSNITIRCGNYAFNKLQKIGEIENKAIIRNINGESFTLIKVPELDKKQLIISKDINFYNHNKHEVFQSDGTMFSEEKNLTSMFPDDIVLYFA